MSITTLKPVIPKEGLIYDLMKLGGEDLVICYQCGSCTAICPLSEVYNVSFRKTIKYAQLGLEDKILSDTTPWLCYACGECSDSCPRDAKPTNILASIRRYLTIKYDRIGISRAVIFSKMFEILSILLLVALSGILILLFHGPVITDEVALELFAPPSIVEFGGFIILGLLAIFFVTNLYTMYRYIMQSSASDISIPFTTYVKELLKCVPVDFLTQRSMSKCRERRNNWLIHLLIFYGFALAFILSLAAMFRLYTNTTLPIIFSSPLSLIGVVSFIALMAGISIVIYGRVTKAQPVWSYSHQTDWVFITLLTSVTLTGILTGVFRYLNLPIPTYVVYSLHLMLIVPFLLIEMPFGKWSHFLYRPFAIYFYRLKEIKNELAETGGKLDNHVIRHNIGGVING